MRATRAGGGDSEFTAANPPYGAILDYYLPAKSDDLRFEVQDAAREGHPRDSGPRERSRDRPASHRLGSARESPAGNDAGRAGGRRGGGEGGGEGGGGRGGAPRGAQVLPGVYTVKMIVGSTAAEQKVTVELDPELKVSAADLEAQWQTLDKISSMIRSVADMLRESDRHSDSASWTKFHASLTGSRMAQQLQSLFTLVDGPNDAPTSAMTKLLDEIQSGYDHSVAEFQTLK